MHPIHLSDIKNLKLYFRFSCLTTTGTIVSLLQGGVTANDDRRVNTYETQRQPVPMQPTQSLSAQKNSMKRSLNEERRNKSHSSTSNLNGVTNSAPSGRSPFNPITLLCPVPSAPPFTIPGARFLLLNFPFNRFSNRPSSSSTSRAD